MENSRPLTAHEKELIGLMMANLSDVQIGERLGMSAGAVRNQFWRLGVEMGIDLKRFDLRTRLVWLWHTGQIA